MSRDKDWKDDDDDLARRQSCDRYQSDEDDDYDRPPRYGSAAKSGAVTALAVINIVLGSLVALLGLWVLLRGFFCAGPAFDMNQFRPNPGRRYPGVPGGVVVVCGLLILLLGVALIMAGVGIVRRRPWGRILTLVLAGFVALAVLRSLFELTAPGIGLPVNLVEIIVQLVFIVLGISYVVVSYTLLFKSRYAAEFRL